MWYNGRELHPTYMGLELAFFEDSMVIDVVGDFSFAPLIYDSVVDFMYPQSILCLWENHDPPYFFLDFGYSVLRDGKPVSDTVTNHRLPVLFPIIEPRCYEVDSVEVSVDSAGCIRATWDTLPRQSQWVVSYGPEGMAPEGYDTVDTASWQRCDLQPGTRYTLAVRSRCTNLNTYSWSPWSAAATVEIQTDTIPSDTVPSGIVGADLPEFTLTPNPTTGRVTVTLEAPAEAGVTMELYDSEGRRVATYAVAAGATEQTLDLAALPAGVYHLRMLTQKGTASRRVVVR